MKFKYEQMNDVMRLLKEFSIVPSMQRFEMDCCIGFSVRRGDSERLRTAFENLRTVEIGKQ